MHWDCAKGKAGIWGYHNCSWVVLAILWVIQLTSTFCHAIQQLELNYSLIFWSGSGETCLLVNWLRLTCSCCIIMSKKSRWKPSDSDSHRTEDYFPMLVNIVSLYWPVSLWWPSYSYAISSTECSVLPATRALQWYLPNFLEAYLKHIKRISIRLKIWLSF